MTWATGFLFIVLSMIGFPNAEGDAERTHLLAGMFFTGCILIALSGIGDRIVNAIEKKQKTS